MALGGAGRRAGRRGAATLAAFLAFAFALGSCVSEPTLDAELGGFVVAVLSPSDSISLVDVRGFGTETDSASVAMTTLREGSAMVRFGTLRPFSFPDSLSLGCGPDNAILVGSFSCFEIDQPLFPKDSVEISVVLPGRASVYGATGIPGPFDIHEAEVQTLDRMVRAVWSRSDGAAGYLLSVLDGVDCQLRPGSCLALATTMVTDTFAVLPLRSGVGRPAAQVVVQALDRNLLDFIQTGVPGLLLPIPPVSNVENAWGVVGSMVERSALIEGAR